MVVGWACLLSLFDWSGLGGFNESTMDSVGGLSSFNGVGWFLGVLSIDPPPSLPPFLLHRTT